MPTLEEESMGATEALAETQPLIVQDWGLIEYNKAMQEQLALVQEVAEKNIPGYLVFCTHPPVVTLGRGTQKEDLFSWQGETVEVSRGGRATYHGPSQIIVYPILNLRFSRYERKEKEIVGFLRDFEKAIIQTLDEIGIQAQGRSLQKKQNTEQDETGVWVGSRKLASLGVAVKKWVTYHGAAINFDNDPQAFQGINPCGFKSSVMISIQQLLNRPVSRQQFQSRLMENLLRTL